MKKPTLKKSSKEHPSKENLVETTKPPSRWKKFKPRCPKCFKKNETKTVQISTITKGSDIQKLPKKSCFKQYMCCFCYKCKLKRGKKAERTEQPKSKAKCCPLRCFSCKNSFRNIFNKISCKRKKKSVNIRNAAKSDSGIACVNVPKKRGCCGNCKSGVFKCLGILCCLNTAFCLKLNNCCKKVCCSKCLCCGGKKNDITEPERRKSTISTPKKRRWTRMFTVSEKILVRFCQDSNIICN